jgi:predicted RNA-binding Zn-ribbon protein involved in translation (DUF1610 family)
MTTELATQALPGGTLIAPVMNVALAKERLMQLQQFVKEYLVDGEDFGTIPGTPKPTLYKPGADKLCELYGLADEYEVTQRTEDFEKGLFDYEVKCVLLRKPEMTLVSSGLGSCNSYEKKYRWREAKRKCPNCGKETIIKGKEEYGGGFVCWAKNGDCCKAKFADNDPSIVNQSVGRVQNEDIADLKNTILKMSKKRAKVDAVLSATRSSGLFTQDMEDWDIPKAEQNRSAEPAHASQKPGMYDQPRVGKDGLEVTVERIKEFPAQEKPKLNACTSVVFVGALKGENQGVPWEAGGAWCYHGSLLEALKKTPGKVCTFRIKERDKKINVTDEWPTHFIDIEDIVFIDGDEYKEGKPIINATA